jgi:hypothetical protein
LSGETQPQQPDNNDLPEDVRKEMHPQVRPAAGQLD